MSIESWLLFAALSILPAFSPGPGLLLTMSNSLRFGTRVTLWSAWGNTVGIGLLGLIVAFGLGSLMAASEMAFFALKIIGGGYLVWLGIKTWRDRSSLIEDATIAETPKATGLFFSGVGVALTNPKAMAVLLSIMPPFLNHPETVYQDGFLLAFTYAAICLSSHLTVAILSGRLRIFVTTPKRMRHLRRGVGATFMAFGAALAAASR